MGICFVPGCNHAANGTKRNCKYFFRFPTGEMLRKKWINNIRSDREPSEYSLVCSCHFKDEDRTNGPTIFIRTPGALQSINRPSTSGKRTACGQSTQTHTVAQYGRAIKPKHPSIRTKVDKSTQTEPSLHLQLCETTDKLERMHARIQTTDKFIKLACTGGIEYEDNDLETDMAEYASTVYQFKVSLQHIKPQIWRRFQVPADFSFKELHLAIQCVMGWQNYHLYMFRMGTKRIDIGNKFFPYIIDQDICVGNERDGDNIISASDTKLPRFFKKEKSRCVYEYDFGKSWMHDVVLERILPRKEEDILPRCLNGKRNCPPEDGIYSSDSEDDDDKTRAWKKKRRDPEFFDLNAVKFNFKNIDNDF
ncbi:hypothetical protein JTE90_025886 [Oedothorax gibbosus]|uniref:THAP-type domain-containing protein n=1 Tax=Oedothorax gibbosus TaxID=931172 RepID=A0AAV6UNA7_9ARAC|nr:hypothetical protein JTE90_025886 [Oedothorax gibbosus]